jgi:hypothetical protein
MEAERRRVSRFQFIAPVELVDESSGALMTSYVTDLGLKGCLVGVSEPPREGSALRLKIITVEAFFEARATVVHSRPNHMGLMFDDVNPKSLNVLHRWLETAKFPKAGV